MFLKLPFAVSFITIQHAAFRRSFRTSYVYIYMVNKTVLVLVPRVDSDK